MNNSGVLPQEKMELDLEIPSSLVQSDGHLRRSNSAPMINGLRFYSIFETFPQQSFSESIWPFSVKIHDMTLNTWVEEQPHDGSLNLSFQ